jgi:hypothetical protein
MVPYNLGSFYIMLGPPLLYAVQVQAASVISSGSWTATSGTLATTIDEYTPDDTDYNYTTTFPTTFEVKFTAHDDPVVHTQHRIQYRGVGNYTVALKQGSTTIASWAEADGAFTTHTRWLTTTQAASITDYSDLRLEVTSA